MKKLTALLLFILLLTGWKTQAQFPWYDTPVPNPFGIENPVAPPPGAPTILRLGDFDNDGVKEAITVVGINAIGAMDVRYFENAGSNAAPDFQYVESYPFGITVNVAPWQFVDIDGDCDLDIFHFTPGQNYPLRFVKNTGTPDSAWFGDSQIEENPFGFVPPTNDKGSAIVKSFFYFIDIDDDHDFDLVYGGNYPNGLPDENYYFYINQDSSGKGTAPDFSEPPLVNPFNLPKPAKDAWIYPGFADMDCDGDWDFFSTYAGQGILYFENKGTTEAPHFGGAPDQTWFLPDPVPVGMLNYNWGDWIDIGGDGDFDMLSGEGSSQILFYENNSQVPMACLGPLPKSVPTTEAYAANRLLIFPNPTHDEVRLQFDNVWQGDLYLLISDVYGNVCRRQFFKNQTGSEVRVDLNGLPPGAYLLSMGSGSGNFSKLVIKQ